jgi:hypothetical protein
LEPRFAGFAICICWSIWNLSLGESLPMNTHPESNELWQLAESSATVAQGAGAKNELVARKIKGDQSVGVALKSNEFTSARRIFNQNLYAPTS